MSFAKLVSCLMAPRSSAEPKSSDLFPKIDVYHVCVGDLRQDVESSVEMAEDTLQSFGVALTGSFKDEQKKRKPTGLYMSKGDFYKRYGSDKRYNYMKPVDDPATARLYLQYLCLAAAEVRACDGVTRA
jgi:hypothetical protein